MESERDGSPEAPAPGPERGRWPRWIVPVAAAAALLHPAACLVGRWDWRADLITHFQGPALAATIVAVAAAARPRPRLALALAALGVYQAWPMFRYDVGNPVAPDPDLRTPLRILSANLLFENDRFEDLAALIRREQPDIVGLIEFSPPWLEGLAQVRGEFPYRVEFPRGGEGLALWFRDPPRTMDPVRTPGPDCWPFFHATFEFGGELRHLWLVHPRSPLGRRETPELAALAAEIGRVPGSRIVIGDMNASEGSPRFADFLEATGLRDSRLGFGRQPSWPAWSPYRIAIDHAFLSPDLAVVDRRLGPEIGSDHLPLIVDVAPASSTKAASRSKSE